MAFDDSTVSDVRAVQAGSDLYLSWSSSSPAGTAFQVYAGNALRWGGKARRCVVPVPAEDVAIHVGSVGADEDRADFSASLPVPAWGGGRVRLQWYGGRFLSETIAGFRAYRSSASGGAVDYTRPIVTIAAFPQGIYRDGAGVGPAGRGGAGRSAVPYEWTSGTNGAGNWTFAVKPYDSAGIEGTALTWTVAVSGPPAPPAANAAGERLTRAYSPSTGVVTLNWLASPG
jgi:hypothetical protein